MPQHYDTPWGRRQAAAPASGGLKPWEKRKQALGRTVPGSGGRGRGRSTPPTGDALQSFTGFFGGVNRAVPGLVDAVAGGLSMIPGVDIPDPVGGIKSAKRAVPALFPEPPDTKPGRVIARGGKELGNTLLPAAKILQVAKRVPQVLQSGANLAKRVGKKFFDPISEAPLKAAIGETAAATAAGAGAGVALEMFPGDTNAEIIGQVLGGFTPTILANMPAAVAVRLVNEALKRFSPEAAAKHGAKEVRKLLSSELNAEARLLLDEADVLRKEIPGFNPSIAETTGAPALVATQRQLEKQASGASLETFAARRASSEQAVERFADDQAPTAADSPDLVATTANKQVDKLRAGVDAGEAAVDIERRVLAEKLPTVDRSAAGETIRTTLIEARDTARTSMTKLAEKLGINSEDVTVPFDAWRKATIREARPESEFGDTIGFLAVKRALSRKRAKPEPAAASQILDPSGRPVQSAPQPETSTFQDVKAVRERLSDAITDAIGAGNPSRKKLRSLIIARNRVDEFIKDLADSDVSGRYEQFRKAYFDEYIQPFEKGTTFKVRKRDGRGFYQTPDEKVAEAFWQPRNITAARQFKAVMSADPDATAALEGVALDSLRDAAVRDGVIEPKLFVTWMRKFQSVLDEFPSIKGAVDDIGKADQALATRQGDLNTQRQLIEDRLLTRELSSFAAGQTTGDQVINAALKAPRKMAQLVSDLKAKGSPPEALGALRRNVWDRALKGDSTVMLDFLTNNEQALSNLFQKPHLDAIKKIAAARAMHEKVPAPTGRGFEAVPLEKVEKFIGQGIPQAGSRVFAFQSGRMQKGYLMLDTFMRAIRNRSKTAAEDLFKVALYDPQTAREVAKVLDLGDLGVKEAKRLQARYFALAPTLIPDEEEQTAPQRSAPEPTTPGSTIGRMPGEVFGTSHLR